ncbi:MAG: type II toxin-antitoxin system RelE family toxin [Dehalococcoidales bacterium]
MVYKIQIARAAQKQILSLPREAQIEISQAIDRLANIPRPAGCKKLKGTELWRFRLGRYRVVYQIIDKTRIITIVKVALRREDTYRGL